MIAPVDVLVKFRASGTVPEVVLAVKFAVGVLYSTTPAMSVEN